MRAESIEKHHFPAFEHSLRPMTMSIKSYKWMISYTYKTLFQPSHGEEGKREKLLVKICMNRSLGKEKEELISPFTQDITLRNIVFHYCQNLSFLSIASS